MLLRDGVQCIGGMYIRCGAACMYIGTVLRGLYSLHSAVASLNSHDLEHLDGALAVGRQKDARVLLPAYAADELSGVVLGLFPLQERPPILRASHVRKRPPTTCPRVRNRNRRTVAGLAELNLNWTIGLDSAL